MVVRNLSNEEFGRRIGVSHSMASRIRSGKRLPGTRVIGKIHREFDIPLEALVAAHDEGREAFGRLIRDQVDSEELAGAAST
jgi:transcriptional regulator with XRE-family HTH domain